MFTCIYFVYNIILIYEELDNNLLVNVVAALYIYIYIYIYKSESITYLDILKENNSFDGKTSINYRYIPN